jgi:hypothetical protein
MDESGTHDLKTVDMSFPVFTLALLICSKPGFVTTIDPLFRSLKTNYFGDDKKVLHSIDIRKSQKEFACLPPNSAVKSQFLTDLSRAVDASPFHLVTVSIRTGQHKAKYYSAVNRYELALEFALERLVYCAELHGHDDVLVIAESRGRKDDLLLKQQFDAFTARGNNYIKKDRIDLLKFRMIFRRKAENIVGLQLADLAASPVARYVLDPKKANPAFAVLRPKFYRRGNRISGLKIFP